MKILSMFTAAAAVVAIGGCGSAADPAPAAPSSASPAAQAVPPSTAELRRALLTVADLPSGYATDAEIFAGTGGAHPVASCRIIMGSLADAVEADVVGKAETAFTAGEAGPFLAESVASLRAADATAETARLERSLTACKTFRFTDTDGVAYEYTVKPVSFPSVGDESSAVRVTLTTENSDYDFTMDAVQVLVRVDQTLATVFSMGIPSAMPAARLEQAVKVAVAKL
jgi:hypothetical protein